MKVAVTSQGPDGDCQVDPRFGRAKYFIVLDTDGEEVFTLDNGQNLNALQGAGIQAAQNVIDVGVEAVITGSVGPKAFAALQAGGVEVYTGATGLVKEVIEQFKAGQLRRAGRADVEGHWI